MLVEKLKERARARGMKQFTTLDGQVGSLEGLVDRLTLRGHIRDEEDRMAEIIRDDAAYGILPEGTTLETLRERGTVRWQGWGLSGHGLAQASTIRPDEVHSPFRWHTEEKVPYPTLTRRAQFYIDHEWFLEAGEELPVHKENPNHGGDPVCVEVCPNNAMFKRQEDGLVLRDEDACRGAQDCARACPYKKIYFNKARNFSQHCIGCFPRIEVGVAPACVRQCPGRAAFVGFLDDEASAVHRLVQGWQVALPLHPEFGTRPNVYYVPPLAPVPLNPDGSPNEGAARIPPEYLEPLFGPEVHRVLDTLKSEMEKRQRGELSELMDTLILYRWVDALGPFAKDPAEIVWR